MGTTIVAPSGVQTVSVNATGNQGTNTFSYWVVAATLQGQLQVSPAEVIRNAPSPLNAGNTVVITWVGVAGATSYTVIRTNGEGPFPGSASNCVVEVGSDLIAVDNGGALGSFTYAPLGASTSTGGVSTQTDVKASRALGTVFRNTGTSPRYVAVSAFKATSASLEFVTDSNATPTTITGIQGNLPNFDALVFGIVLPGNYYSIVFDTGGGTLDKWVEWS